MFNVGDRVKNLVCNGEVGTIVETTYLKPLSSNDPLYGTRDTFTEAELCLALNNPNDDYGYFVKWDETGHINPWVKKELEKV